MRKRNIELSSAGIQKMTDLLEKQKETLDKQVKTFVMRCAQKGVEIAKVEFAKAEYTGTNKHKYIFKRTSDNTAIVRVESYTVLFIEFGTGINYPDDHPEALENGMFRGEYGYKLGRLRQWRYKGDPGTLGEVITEGEHAGEVISRGNPANMSLYHTREQLADVCLEIAKEVFK